MKASSCQGNSESCSKTCILYQSVPFGHNCNKLQRFLVLGFGKGPSGTEKVRFDVVVDVWKVYKSVVEVVQIRRKVEVQELAWR